MTLKKTLAAGITVLALGGIMTACSDDDDSTSSDSKETTSETGSDTAADDTAAEDTAEEGAGEDADVSTGGETSVKVEGKDLDGLDLSTVTCVKQGGKINIASGAIGGQEGLAIVLTDEAEPKVEAFSMVVDGSALAVSSMAGAKVGSAEVAVDGDTYTLTGKAEGADLDDPSAGMISKEFEIKVSCS